MIGDAHRLEHPGIADELDQLLTFVRPVQAGRDDHVDAIPRHARSKQCLDQRPQKEMIGNRPGDVADQNTSRALAVRVLEQWRHADRLFQAGEHRASRVVEHGHRMLLDEMGLAVGRRIDGKSALAIEQVDGHGASCGSTLHS